jgi:probable HAF family extracellular repeat protein
VSATGLNNSGFVLLNVFGPQDNPSRDDCLTLYHDGSLIHRMTANVYATGINDHNEIIGTRTEGGETVGFGPRCDFDRSGSVITPAAINDRGQIAGTSANGVELCTDGVWQVLPEFPGALEQMQSASAMNNKGEVVGTESVAVGPGNIAAHGFLYSNGKTVDIGVLSDGGFLPPSTYPESINENGQIVGYAFTGTGGTAFLYQDGKIYDLNKLISVDDPLSGLVQLLGGSQINDGGVIAANGTDSRTGATHVYVLTPHRAASAEQ